MSETSRSEFITIGQNRSYTFYQSDCIAAMATDLKPESIDVIITSPPYNLGTSYSSYDDHQPRQEYLRWMQEWGNPGEERAITRWLTFF